MNLAAPQTRLLDRARAPFELINPGARSRYFLVCDHASNLVPTEFDTLGLAPEQLELHIAYDIGAAAMTRRMAQVLRAPAVLAGFSRLLIDANRMTGHVTSIPETSDGITIPGNRQLSEDARQDRIARYFEPYHQAITAGLETALAAGERPILVSLHSFTAVMRDFQRPWQVGVLWDRDDRMAAPLIQALSARGLTVGDNQPYSGGTDFGFTMQQHALPPDLPQVFLEVRQDLIEEDRGARVWAELLAKELQTLAIQAA